MNLTLYILSLTTNIEEFSSLSYISGKLSSLILVSLASKGKGFRFEKGKFFWAEGKKVCSYAHGSCNAWCNFRFSFWYCTQLSMNSCFIILKYRQVRICLSLLGIAEHDAISDFVFGIGHSHWALNLFSTFCKQVWTILNKFDLVCCYRAWCNFGFSCLNILKTTVNNFRQV